MRITKVVVKDLFGIFNHEIPLNIDNHITLIHGPNGVGKTVILSMLDAFFKSRYHKLSSIPFSEFLIYFEDKSCLRLNKLLESGCDDENDNNEIIKLIIALYENGSEKDSYIVPFITRQNIDFPLGIIENEISGLERVGRDTWFYLPTREKLSLDDVLYRFQDRLPFGKSNQIKKNEPIWLSEIIDSIHIGFIETERLLNYSYSHRLKKHDGRASLVPAVINYSEELVSAIQTILADYGSLSQSLDRSFPTRLVKNDISPDLTIDELKIKWNELEEKRSKLMAAGLLDQEEDIDFPELQSMDKSNINVLSVYVGDVQEKLQVFDELTDKIDLLVSIIKNKFQYKEMSISKKEGFVFKTSDGNILSPTNLSSGEQHELVLLYELLFKVSPNSLLLIDEPELSLDVTWQQQFLKDLQKITKLSAFDALIATHSPQIIHDRWDLTVELKGPLND